MPVTQQPVLNAVGPHVDNAGAGAGAVQAQAHEHEQQGGPDDTEEDEACCTWPCCKLVCWLFCCPPCPPCIVAKQAFLPPNPPFYTFEEAAAAGNAPAAISMKIQDPEVFDPEPKELTMVDFTPPMEVVPAFITSSQRHKIATYHLKMPQARYTILFSHGNAADIGGMAPLMVHLAASLNCSIFAYDYSGYGLSSGKTREANQYKDIKAAFKHMTQTLNISPDSIIIYGQSIGTSPSCNIASKIGAKGEPLGGVVLHSPMLSGIRLLRPQCTTTICIDPFQNIKKMPKITAPCLIIHGQQDFIVPFSHGHHLYNICENPVEPFFPPACGHDDIESHRNYIPRLRVFLDELDTYKRSIVEM